MKIHSVALVALGMALGYAGGVATLAALAQEDAKQWSVFGAIGQSNYGAASNGSWAQQAEGRETQRNFRPRAWEIGGSYQFTNSPVSVSASYFNGGMAKMNAIAINYPDDDASKHDASIDTLRQECRDKPAPDCTLRWRGQGSIKGFTLIGAYDLLKIGQVTVTGGGGLSLYHATWSAQVFPMDPDCLGSDNKCKWRITVNQRSDWLVSPVAQLKVKYSHLYLKGQRQFRTVQHSNVTTGYGDSLATVFAGVEVFF